MKIKTIEDIDWKIRGDANDKVMVKQVKDIVLREVKREAIKWIKADINTIKQGPKVFKKKWKNWINFFNITEEDLQ